MARIKYTADFETTTDPKDCRVWAYGICEIENPDNFIYGNTIDEFMEWCEKEKDTILYFHNLKFDGEFIFSWLFKNGFKHIIDKSDKETKTFTTLISDKGQFYCIEIYFYVKGKSVKKVKIYDSLKIIPFSVEQVAKAFNLPISKLEIDYTEKREIGHFLTEKEVSYLKNDVEIMARALNVLFEQNLTKMTQGSNALFDFKNIFGQKRFERDFPAPDYDADIRQAYKGGFTYLSPRYTNKNVGEGIVLDVNSLYPSVMYYCPMPYSEGKFFKGKYENDELYNIYVQMFTCQFELKKNFIPTIQMKNSLLFVPTEYLTSSNGEDVTMCLTSVDLKLFFEHYNVYNLEWHSGWKFRSVTGLFCDYIDKWMKIKVESTLNGNMGMRTLSKLMLNALYGKFALNPNVQSKIPYMDKDGIIKYKLGEKEKRKPIYIPMGVFITAYAREKTIRSAQSVYNRFIYADTDSLHLEGTEIPENLEIDPVKLGAWKHESTFKQARFLRQKSYIEEIDGKLNVTCAGMPQKCHENVNWDNFKIGTLYPGKLQPTHVPGGVVLKDIAFTIKK